MITGGYLFAYFTTSTNQIRNAWYNRPDLKPFPAMVAKEGVDITEETAKEMHYQSYRNKKYRDEKKKTAWYRILFPVSADYEAVQNPYAKYNSEDVYHPGNGFYSTTTNRFRDHY